MPWSPTASLPLSSPTNPGDPRTEDMQENTWNKRNEALVSTTPNARPGVGYLLTN